MARPPRKPPAPAAPDLEAALRDLTGFLQERPLATAALITLALAIGAGTSTIGRPRPERPRLPASGSGGRREPLLVSPPPPAVPPALTRQQRKALERQQRKALEPPRIPRRRKGLAVAAFELKQQGPGGRKTDVDFTWTAPKRKPGSPEPPPVRHESRVGVGLFEFEHSNPGGKDTAIKFGWSKEPLEPPAAPAGAATDAGAPAASPHGKEPGAE